MFLPRRLQSGMLISYIIFIIYETLMFREQGNIRSNLKLFSYAQTFLTDQRIRKDVINNIWLLFHSEQAFIQFSGKRESGLFRCFYQY